MKEKKMEQTSFLRTYLFEKLLRRFINLDVFHLQAPVHRRMTLPCCCVCSNQRLKDLCAYVILHLLQNLHQVLSSTNIFLLLQLAQQSPDRFLRRYPLATVSSADFNRLRHTFECLSRITAVHIVVHEDLPRFSIELPSPSWRFLLELFRLFDETFVCFRISSNHHIHNPDVVRRTVRLPFLEQSLCTWQIVKIHKHLYHVQISDVRGFRNSQPQRTPNPVDFNQFPQPSIQSDKKLIRLEISVRVSQLQLLKCLLSFLIESRIDIYRRHIAVRSPIRSNSTVSAHLLDDSLDTGEIIFSSQCPHPNIVSVRIRHDVFGLHFLNHPRDFLGLPCLCVKRHEAVIRHGANGDVELFHLVHQTFGFLSHQLLAVAVQKRTVRELGFRCFRKTDEVILSRNDSTSFGNKIKMDCLIRHRLVHTSMFHYFRELECWVIEAATSEFLDRIADFPFEGVLSAFEEVIQLLFDIDLVATTFEEQIVKRFFDVLLRRSSRDVSRPAQMWHRHFFFFSRICNQRRWKCS
uniref:Uncharacterized protein n=1 Tax=Noccaea caerulescens TaxID=107243 RepID=A0A1J3F3M7_NOCCA